MEQFIKKNWDKSKYFIFLIATVGLILSISVSSKNSNKVAETKDQANTTLQSSELKSIKEFFFPLLFHFEQLW